MKEERRKQMSSVIAQKQRMTMEELVEHFGVSMNTIRADDAYLVKTGAVEKIYGGVRAAEHKQVPLFASRAMENTAQKRRIAMAAEAYIEDHDIIFIDAGTTAFSIAKALSHLERITIITNDLFTAAQLELKPSCKVMVTGGMRRSGFHELVGAVAEDFIRSTHADIAFIGVDGIDLMGNVCSSNFEEMGVKRMMLRTANRSVIVADHQKIGRTALVRICDLKDADLLICDNGIPSEQLKKLRKVACEIILA